MANYVERDGDWVLRPPGNLDHVNMYVFALRAGATELQALCDRFINHPTGNAVQATPVFPGFPFVLVTCADIQKGYSQDVDDAGHGWMPERDVGIFVPVTLTWGGGQQRVANLLPYLYVDNFAAVLIGREVFGFPKVLADIAFGGSPWSCAVTSTVSVTNNPAQPAGDAAIVTVNKRSPLPGIPVPGQLANALPVIIDALRAALGMPPPASAAFATIPMVFLKQFRAAVVPPPACHQSVVLAEAGITQFYGGELWGTLGPLAPFAITMPPYHSVDIGQHLGLPGGPTYHPVLSVRATIDFGLPFGKALWTAP
ncbi:MAG: acetoacetate decarboxylase family protein [Candidatus Binatia bacterium]